jgi:uracil-DNA glycosylase
MSNGSGKALAELAAEVHGCRRCPRLVEWREAVAADPPRRYRGEDYWAKPAAGFGDPAARVAIVGLAPAAHGANRTGRMFTGDRSGDWLYAALYRVGLANRPVALSAGDGLELNGVRITAPVHCAPPANKPTTAERDTCRGWLTRELELLWPSVRAVVVLGAFGWTSLWPTLRACGIDTPARVPRFAHGVEAQVDGRLAIGSYHVSQQNTFTGRLTEPMLDAVLKRAADAAGLSVR